MKKTFVLAMVFAALVFIGCGSNSKVSGTYTSTKPGLFGPIAVETTITNGKLTGVNVLEHHETPGLGSYVVDVLPAKMVEAGTPNVDAITGVTVTSSVLKQCVVDCMNQAGVKIPKAPARVARKYDTTADVVIVGGGGAGLAAAVAATDAGASVILIEKTDLLGGNSIVAGGFMNTPDPARQDHKYLEKRSPALETLITDAINEKSVSEEHKKIQDAVRAEYEAYLKTDKTLFDSPNWFALQTWNGGDKVGRLEAVKMLADNALDTLHWLEGMGQEFDKNVKHGGGALYPRSHQALLPNGTGYIKALREALDGRKGLTILTHTNGDSLIVENGRVVGVKATDLVENKKIEFRANKGVILATGGFAGNVELRQKYCEGEKWPNLGNTVRTTNLTGVTGDGIFMAEAVGTNLVNMEQIQLLPYCDPDSGFVNNTPLNTKIYVFINQNGERFVREDGRRDDISKAIIAQPGGYGYMLCKETGDLSKAITLAGQPVTYLIENNVSKYGYAKNLAEAAKHMNVPEDKLRAAVKEYDDNVRAQGTDRFGRVSYSGTLDDGPFVMVARTPSAHHTMGGVDIDTQTHALRADGSVIPGLYCAGEITGVVHGANRIGGNAIADFCIYGRIAGTNAAKGN